MQTRIESLVETGANYASGFLIAWMTMQWVVTPLWGLGTDAGQNLGITVLFTAVSIARSYFWRRFFNAGLHHLLRRVIA
jgi:hypothetical protein